jgi:metal-responsive CopG/Arc/MetJ family transcriptional regulator
MAVRFTVSIPEDEEELLEKLDKGVKNKRFRNRSEGVREALEIMFDSESYDVKI